MNTVKNIKSGDTITLSSDSGSKREIRIDEVIQDYFMGGIEPKVKIRSGEINLVLKKVSTSNFNSFPSEQGSQSERYYEKWKILKENDIPTVSSMEIVDSTTVAMGDMTSGGSRFFGKEMFHKVFDEEVSESKSLTEIERKYLEIDIKDIEKEIERIQLQAYSKGIMLPRDDPYSILVHPDGTWEVVVLDVGKLTPVQEETVEDLNDSRRDMMDEIKAVRAYFKRVSIT